jgi:uncharacterized membrane protein YhaH (DUF805 family)
LPSVGKRVVDDFVKGLFSFKGRMRRAAFFVFSITIFTTVFLFAGIWTVLPIHGAGRIVPTGIVLVICLVATWANLAVIAKRLHDMNKSAKHLLWIFLPSLLPFLSATTEAHELSWLAAWLIAMWLVVMPGTKIRNRFGPPPT